MLLKSPDSFDDLCYLRFAFQRTKSGHRGDFCAADYFFVDMNQASLFLLLKFARDHIYRDFFKH